jgi:hypothetical protein
MVIDTESFVSAGVAAVQIANGVVSQTRVLNALYNGMGFHNGMQAFY